MAKKRGNSEGTVVRRRDGRWMAQMTTGRDATTGKPKRSTFYGKTRQAGADQLAKALSDLGRGSFVAPHKISLAAWLDRWLKDYKQPQLRPVSFDSYEMLIRYHIKPALGHFALKELRPDHLQHFYNAKREAGLSPRTIRYLHTVLHGALKQAMKNQLVIRNVSEATTLPTGKTRKMQPLTLKQVNQFLAAMKKNRLFPALFLEVGTGLRRGEILALRWRDLDLDASVLHVRQTLVRVRNYHAAGSDRKTRLLIQEPKTDHSRRTIPIPEDIVEALKHHKAQQAQEKLLLGHAYDDQGLVFCQVNGQLLDPVTSHVISIRC